MILADIAEALATRYSSGSLTAPTGYTTVQSSTHLATEGGGKTPFVRVVFEGLSDLGYVASRRSGAAMFRVRFYAAQAASLEDTTTMLYAWHDVLVDRPIGQLQLGEGATTNAVSGAYIRETSMGLARLGDVEYAVIDLLTEVRFSHAATFVA